MAKFTQDELFTLDLSDLNTDSYNYDDPILEDQGEEEQEVESGD